MDLNKQIKAANGKDAFLREGVPFTIGELIATSLIGYEPPGEKNPMLKLKRDYLAHKIYGAMNDGDGTIELADDQIKVVKDAIIAMKWTNGLAVDALMQLDPGTFDDLD